RGTFIRTASTIPNRGIPARLTRSQPPAVCHSLGIWVMTRAPRNSRPRAAPMRVGISMPQNIPLGGGDCEGQILRFSNTPICGSAPAWRDEERLEGPHQLYHFLYH